MATTKKLLQAAAGTAYGGGAGGLNVEDVFSTYLYDGTGSAQTITNGIDLSGEGGMVWIKGRETTENHVVADTERGAGSTSLNDAMFTNLANGATSNDNYVTAFNSDGFNIGTRSEVSSSTYTFASWTWRKAPKFFDCVTWTGDGSTSGKTISHNLGTTPGCIIVKRIDDTGSWRVWHKDTGAYFLTLQTTEAKDNTFIERVFGNGTSYVAPTSTDFTVGYFSEVNASGATYVAYLFAHNDGDGEFGPTGDQDIIKCGSYTGNGSATGPEINLGWEPQWLLVKRSDTAGPNWNIYDNMRGVATGVVDAELTANLTNAESSANDRLSFTSTGFKLDTSHGSVNGPGDYIYIAIRRGPMAVPTDATEVFAVDLSDTNSDTDRPCFISGFPVDFAIYANPASGGFRLTGTRLTGGYFDPTTTAAEGTSSNWSFDWMNGWRNNFGTANYPSWMWRRAPNYFDVVTYTGDGTTSHSINHSLGVVPEMMWVKRRNASASWSVYHPVIGNQGRVNLNNSNAANSNQTGYWASTDPTDTHFTVGIDSDMNAASGTYIAYLFASLDGVSKVGSYTGNGTWQNINCGFSTGARFVLIRRTDSTGDWEVYDTARGINAGNDSHLQLNTTTAEFLSADTIDPYSAGFTVNVDGTDIRSNESGASYIFYAIA